MGDYRLRRCRGDGRVFNSIRSPGAGRMEVGWKEGQWAVTEKTRQRGLGHDKVGETGGRDLALQDPAGQSKDFNFQF